MNVEIIKMIVECGECEFKSVEEVYQEEDGGLIEITTGCNIFNLGTMSPCSCFNINKSKYYNELIDYQIIDQKVMN
jgi:hypothetical protein